MATSLQDLVRQNQNEKPAVTQEFIPAELPPDDPRRDIGITSGITPGPTNPSEGKSLLAPAPRVDIGLTRPRERDLLDRPGFTKGQVFAQRAIPIVATTLGAGALIRFGGLAGESLLQNKIGEAAARTVGEITTGLITDEGLRRATGEPFDPARALVGGVAAGSGGLQTLSLRAAARPAGISPFAIENVAQRTQIPVIDALGFRRGRGARLTLGTPRPRTTKQVKAGVSDEMVNVVDRIRMLMPQLRKNLQPARLRKEQLLREADATGATISIEKITDVLLKQKIRNPIHQEFISFNKQIDLTVKRLTTLPGGTGRVTALKPSSVDELIRDQLSDKSFSASGIPSTSRIGQAFSKARIAARDALLDILPEEAQQLNKELSEQLALMEMSESRFGHGYPADQTARESTIANLFQPGNTENVRLLNFIQDNVKVRGPKGLTSPDLIEETARIATEREFSVDFRKGFEGTGFFQTIAGSASRGFAKINAPFVRDTSSIAFGALQGKREFERQRTQLINNLGPERPIPLPSQPFVRPKRAGDSTGPTSQELMDRAREKSQRRPTRILDEDSMGAEEVGQ